MSYERPRSRSAFRKPSVISSSLDQYINDEPAFEEKRIAQHKERSDAEIEAFRKEELARLQKEASEIDQQIGRELLSYHPIGRMSELGMVLGVQPDNPNQVIRSFNGQGYVFKKNSAPSDSQLKKWTDMKKHQSEINGEQFNFRHSLSLGNNTTIGNYRVVLNAEKLEKKGLLTSSEIKDLDKLRGFYDQNPELKDPDSPLNNQNWGVVRNGKIELSTPKSRGQPDPIYGVDYENNRVLLTFPKSMKVPESVKQNGTRISGDRSYALTKEEFHKIRSDLLPYGVTMNEAARKIVR